jgi:hypothetical protein
MPDQTTTGKRFKLSEYIKDGDLKRVLRNELADLKGEQLALAQEAIIEVAGDGVPGNFEQLLDQYRQAIARQIHPERKLVKDPHVDRGVIKNPQLAAHLDRELVDITADEMAAVNRRLKGIIDEARRVQVVTTEGGIRYVSHEATEVCRVHNQSHPTIAVEDKHPCGYFRPPEDWREMLRLEVRSALNR